MMRIVFRKTLIAFLMTLVGISVLGCKEKTTLITGTNGAVLPQLTQPDKIFYQGETFDVTYGDLYEEFKANDGINQLLFMADSNLLATYLSAVTQDEIDEKIKLLKYGTIDDEKISEFTAEELEELETNYQQNMLLLGYSDDESVYVRMVVAKENYAIDAMTNELNKDETWYVGESTIANYYTKSYFTDLSAIKIRFYGETDAKNALKDLNLVSYEGTLRRYTGTKPIYEVSSDGFNDTNTQVLTKDDLIIAFLEIYNYVYGDFKPEIPTNTSVASLLTKDELKLNYKDLNAAQVEMAKYVFSTMASYEEAVLGTNTSLFYTYKPVPYAGENDNAYYMILKLDGNNKESLTAFDATTMDLASIIGQEVYDDIEERMIQSNLGDSGFVSNRIAELRKEKNFVIYDYYLGIDYQSVDTEFESNPAGDDLMVATFDGGTITADDLLTFALNKNGSLYILYASQLAYVMDRYYQEVYCFGETTCEFDLSKSDSTKLTDHAKTLAELKTSFESSYYVYYYTFEEYIYLAYGAKSEADMIGKYYVKSTLQPYVIYSEIIKNNWELLSDYLYDLITDYYDNYFSIKVEYLMIYVDRDESGTPDDYEEFIAELTDQAAYDTLVGQFETTIRDYLAIDGNTYATLISAYNKARRDDATWGQFKQYGFYLVTENLKELTYLTTVDVYEEALVDGFAAAYQEYSLEANKTKSSHYYSELVETSSGLYLLLNTKGTNFEKPSAKFEMTYDAQNNPNYSIGIDNPNDKPSIEQLKLYSEKRFYEVVYGTDSTVEETYDIVVPDIPTSVSTAIEAYFTKLHDSMYVVGFLNIIIADDLQTGNFVNQNAAYCAISDADMKAQIAAIRELYFSQVFSAVDTLD
ncbi:MAG: hypothetical protein CVV56_05515 [Tenericutes bacterium HGW-Tenericutes-1]|jgi:hypothetical protein|nr:MAG: hypothetical protein CVV56_05515 [Tenericutes bacterium HGW-Tenericutes-1]